MIWTIKVLNIKVVELITIYNFYFGHFFIWQSISKYCSQIHISLILSWTIRETCWFVNNVYYHFVRWRTDQNKSCRSWSVLQLLCSQLFHLKSFTLWKYYFKLPFFEIQILNCENKVTWKDDQNNSCNNTINW